MAVQNTKIDNKYNNFLNKKVLFNYFDIFDSVIFIFISFGIAIYAGVYLIFNVIFNTLSMFVMSINSIINILF